MSILTQKTTKSINFISILAIFTLIFAIFTLTACSKSTESEETQMINFAQKNKINYIKDPTGILYEIISAGNTTKAGLNSTITVTYVGTLMNGNQFDAGTITYALSGLIKGWQIAVPLIGVGGEIKVLIPSALGYGASGAGSSIPGNAPLYFNIKLSAVK